MKKLKLIKQNTEEILGEERLVELLNTNQTLKHYIGFEISGMLHIGSGLMTAINIKNFLQAGIQTNIFLADWHTWINEKLDGEMETIQEIANNYFKEAIIASMKCVGLKGDESKFIMGTELYSQDLNYWNTVVQVCKILTVSRVKKSSTIMGRQLGDEQKFAKLLYPPMQVADIFALNVDIAHSGLDQRKAHVIAREVAKGLSKEKPIAIHHHLIMGLGTPPKDLELKKENLREIWSSLKMSKSKPDTCIFVHDSPDEIKRKIKKAFCPQNNVEFNPILDWCKHLIFPLQEKLRIDRPEKFGGKVEFITFENLVDAFEQGSLHPMDLKDAVAEAIIDILKPARKHFEEESRKETLEKLRRIIQT